MKRITIETVLFILLSMLIENAIFAQNLPKIISEQLNLYAVNSFEGLRVRSAPSLEGRKIGLLEYQETVECLSIDDKTVVLDNITSNWFKVKAVHKDLEGYEIMFQKKATWFGWTLIRKPDTSKEAVGLQFAFRRKYTIRK